MQYNRKSVAIVAGIAALGIASGTAYALWSSTGTGPSQAKAVSAQALTVSAASGAADLFPGNDGTLYFSVTNPNPYPVTLTTLTPGSVTSGAAGACPASNLTTRSLTGLSLAVPASSTNVALSAPGAVTLVTAAPDGCQGVTFTVNVTLSGTQG